MEQIKHECGVALIRLRKPLEYYKEKYGTYTWGLDKLYLLMEKQHNRGQEAAGIGVVKLNTPAGYEYIYRERELGTDAISKIFAKVSTQLSSEILEDTPEQIDAFAPFIGQIYMGHLRYSTTGRSGMSYVHPFLRRNNWRSRNLMLCGNFNLTNVQEIFQKIVSQGQCPRLYSDTMMLLEQIGYALDKENHRLFREFRTKFTDPALESAIEDNMDMGRVLQSAAPSWDGGFVICGATGSGDMFALRDANGIRPAFYYFDDEVIVVASERPVIQTTFNVCRKKVHELMPGQALIVGKYGQFRLKQILAEKTNKRCSFERIYFSRGSDADIYQERKHLGRLLAEPLYKMIDGDFDKTVFSFIPNTAEVAFMGMTEALNEMLERQKAEKIQKLAEEGRLDTEKLQSVLSKRLRSEKVVIKDIKLRTFIAEGSSREDLATHVYDVTYGIINKNVDTVVAIDDSIVRGTTLRQSIIRMLDRLQPKRIIIVSSSPQVRYPDCYGIDMSRMSEFCAFRAAVSLLKKSGNAEKLALIYEKCVEELKKPIEKQVNIVKMVYEGFSDEDISKEIVSMLTPEDTHGDVEILYQSIEGLHEALPGYPGDWYFSGDYPTPGGNRLVNQAYVNYYEGNYDKR